VPSLQGLPSVAAAPVMSGPLMLAMAPPGSRPVRTVQRRPMRPGQVRALPAPFDVACLAAAAPPHRRLAAKQSHVARNARIPRPALFVARNVPQNGSNFFGE
jgi:hypothetical protein